VREAPQPITVQVPADNPIEHRDQDTIGRADLAARFADQVLAQDVSEGIVVGVLGPWGSGKTSFINLARDRFAEHGAPILDYNPWMFSGAEQLVNSFFIELSAQLKLRRELADIGSSLEEYGEVFSGLGWLPLVGPWIERGRIANKLLSKLLQRRKEGVGRLRARLTERLKSLGEPIVVILDDLDRLGTAEIRDMFKLVRLTASFPNIVYVVAFDRLRVEQALTEEGVPGRDYLEKILQIGIDLPRIPDQMLTRQVLIALDEALSTIDTPGNVDSEVWPNTFAEVIRPLLRTGHDRPS
jgi:predicted KAP-like P-loop ATPase